MCNGQELDAIQQAIVDIEAEQPGRNPVVRIRIRDCYTCMTPMTNDFHTSHICADCESKSTPTTPYPMWS